MERSHDSRIVATLATCLATCLALASLLVAPSAAEARKPAPPPTATVHDPILFVHGFTGSSTNWDTMVSRFRADGWTDAELTRQMSPLP